LKKAEGELESMKEDLEVEHDVKNVAILKRDKAKSQIETLNNDLEIT
jgi:hypothetical protein